MKPNKASFKMSKKETERHQKFMKEMEMRQAHHEIRMSSTPEKSKLMRDYMTCGSNGKSTKSKD